jgi:glycosyltransferase involved in cell wall biosynthesis
MDLVLRAVAPLVREQRLVLVVAGSGPESGALDALATELGADVRFLGHVDDPSELMCATDVLLHASTVEGVPQVVLQALAAGLPVVATSVIGLHEIPDAPIVATSEDPAHFRQAVIGVLDEPPAPLPARLLDGWSPSTVDRRLEELHARIARR